MSRITVLPAVDDGAILVCGERCFALLRHPSRLELLLASPFKERENSAWVVSGFCFDKAALNVDLRSAEVMLVIRSSTIPKPFFSGPTVPILLSCQRTNFRQATCRPRLVPFRQRTHLLRCRPTHKRL